MNLIVDIGNTYSKITIFNPKKNKFDTKFRIRTEHNSLNDYSAICREFNINNCILSSVIPIDQSVTKYFSDTCITFIELNKDTYLPIENCYKTKETLGFDRIAAAVGANKLIPDTNLLIIDIGTAITFDFVDKNNRFIGGNISPGIQTRFNALHDYTQKLPLIVFDENKNTNDESSLFGEDTCSAMYKGVIQGIQDEIEGFTDQCLSRFANLRIFLTGGDANYFVKRLKKTIFAEPSLVYIGLNRILEFNIRQHP